MLAAAPQLGCPPKNGQPDAVCLCSNVDFSNGIRDCVNESCPAGTNTTSIIAYGIAYCDAGENFYLPSPNSKRRPQTKLTPLIALASASASAITTSAIRTTITSGGKTITSTVGSTTIFAAGAAGHS